MTTILVTSQGSCSLNQTYACNSCTKSYAYGSTDCCIGICPTGFALDSSGKECSLLGLSYLLFDTDFTQALDLTTSSIGSFNTPTGTSFLSLRSPVQTKDRGMYFPESSHLTLNNSYIPAPDFTMLMWIRPLNYGTIFSIIGSTNYFILKHSNIIADFLLQLRLCYPSDTCANVKALPYSISSTTRLTSNTDWRYLSITTRETNSSQMQIQMYADYTYVDSIAFNGGNAIGLVNEKFTWTLGDSVSGFQGFVYRIACYNGDYQSDLNFVYPPICDPYYYYENGNCFLCTCPGQIPWCVRGSDCSYCYTNLCSACTGYSPSFCTQMTGTCSDSCYDCASSTYCYKCDPDTMIISSPTNGTYWSEILDIALYSNIIADWMISASDNLIAYPCRGFYFDGYSTILTPREIPVLPTNLLIYMWIKVSNNKEYIISKGQGLIINTDFIQIVLMDNSKNSYSDTISYSSDLNSWMYASFYINYWNFLTTILVSISNSNALYTSKFGYYFQDNNTNSLTIGYSSGSYFTGFIAKIGFAAVNKNPSLYYGGYQQNMPLLCGMLNDCPIYIIGNASDFDTCWDPIRATCYICTYGINYANASASNIVNGTSSLIGGVYFPERGYCLLSAKGLACSSCNNPYVLYDNLCLSNCPTGAIFDGNSNACIIQTSLVFIIIFNKIVLSNGNGFTAGSNSTNAYPIFDINDPIPAYNRGYYFKSNSSITSSNKYIIGPSFSIAIWINLESYGYIYSKQFDLMHNLQLNYHSPMSFKFFTEFGSKTMSYWTMRSAHSWKYIQIESWYDDISITSYLKVFVNTSLTKWLSIEFDFYDDLLDSNFIIGSNTNNGFTGFLYSMEVYNAANVLSMYSTSCNGRSQCPSSTAVLGLCNITQLENSCTECNQSCINGCIRSTDCNLCQDPLCYSCHKFNDSCDQCTLNAKKLETGLCQCNTAYVLGSSNECCDSTCLTCNGQLASNCLSCIVRVLFTPINRCVYALACPTAPNKPSTAIPNDNTCKLQTEKVFYTNLVALQTPFYDTITSIEIIAGDGTAFYPNYSTLDPIPAIGRGYYFNNTSYLNIDPGKYSKLVFGPEFTIGIWIYIITDGSIFMRNNTDMQIIYICSKMYSIIDESGSLNRELIPNSATMKGSPRLLVELTSYDNNLIPSDYESSFNHNTWNLFEIRVESIDEGNSMSVSINGITLSWTSLSYFQDSIAKVITIIGNTDGDANSGFIGFVWSIEIYNIYTIISYNTNEYCIYPLETSDCLSDCLINQFPPNCSDCSNSCSNGCINSQSCSLCQEPLCTSCSEFGLCNSCINGASVNSNNTCNCNNGAYLNANNICEHCYISGTNSSGALSKSCGSCYGPNYYQCLTCIDYLLELICLDECPIGYQAGLNICAIINSGNNPIIQYLFTAINSVYFDNINQIPAICGKTGNNLYPNLDDSDPIPSFQRGLYFTGNGSILSLNYSSTTRLLGINFYISIWVNPYSLTSPLIYRIHQSNLLFSVNIFELYLNIKVLINNSLITCTSTNQMKENAWNHALISVYYNQGTSLSFIINQVNSIITTTQNYPFIDALNSEMYIGSSLTSYFQGFLYSLEIYLELPLIKSLLSNCSACSICLVSGECIPSCNINSFYNNSTCINCPTQCTSGCRNNKNCNLCADENCAECDNYESNSCVACSETYEVKNSVCIQCNSTSYYEKYSKTCIECQGLCTKCYSSINCTECVENSYLINSSGKCICNQGYSGTYECIRTYFNAFYGLTSDNIVFIEFSKPLLNNMTENDIEIKINNIIQSFTLEYANNSTYILTVSFNQALNLSDILTIYFIKNLISTDNSLLEDTFIEIHLFPGSNNSTDAQIAAVESAAKLAAIVSLSLTASSSVFNFNIVSFFNFLNIVELYSYSVLYQVEFSSSFLNFISGTRPNAMMPNAFTCFIYSNDGVQLPDQEQWFGNSVNLFLINSGSSITLFLLFSVFFASALLLKTIKFPLLKTQLDRFIELFKYKFLLRFWLQTNLEFSLNLGLSLIYSKFANITQFIDFVLCCMILVYIYLGCWSSFIYCLN